MTDVALRRARAGLYIARSIVVSYGGTITVDSELDAGSTFTMTVPCSGPGSPT